MACHKVSYQQLEFHEVLPLYKKKTLFTTSNIIPILEYCFFIKMIKV